MGCDIHTCVERFDPEQQRWVHQPTNPDLFNDRNYGLFGWLANVRNYSGIAPFDKVKEGLPDDVSDGVRAASDHWGSDGHSHCHVYANDLLAFDFNSEIEDRRCTKKMPGGWFDGGQTCEPGEGKKQSVAVFLGGYALASILRLAQFESDLTRVRLVFWFDN